jgi:hypothetical protein
LDHLLTTTYRNEVTDIEQVRRDRERFCDVVQAKYPGWKYLGIYEVQPKRLKRTGVAVWHTHMAVAGWQDVDFLRATWREIVGEGNIQVEPPKKGKGDTRLAMARYMSPYLMKAVGEDEGWEMNKKIYYHSKNVIDPPVETVEVEYMAGVETCDMAAVILGTRGGGLASVWESIDSTRGRVASFSFYGGDRARPENHILGEAHPLWERAVREGYCRIGGRPEETLVRAEDPL